MFSALLKALLVLPFAKHDFICYMEQLRWWICGNQANRAHSPHLMVLEYKTVMQTGPVPFKSYLGFGLLVNNFLSSILILIGVGELIPERFLKHLQCWSLNQGATTC